MKILLPFSIFALISGLILAHDPSSSQIQLFRERLLERFEGEGDSTYDFRASWVRNNSDTIIGNWLKYGGNDMDKAEGILHDSLKWRQEYQMDKILDLKFPARYSREYPYQITGFTESGTVVLYCPLGIWDLKRGLPKERPQIMKYGIQMLEKTMAWTNPKTGKPASSFIFIDDLTHYSLKQVTSLNVLSFTTEYLTIFEKNYPYYMESAYVINAPIFFNVIWAIVKAVNPTSTRVVSVYGRRREEWEFVLRRVIPEEAYPQALLPLGGIQELEDEEYDDE